MTYAMWTTLLKRKVEPGAHPGAGSHPSAKAKRVRPPRGVPRPVLSSPAVRAVVQRVREAAVSVDGEVVSRIGRGLLVLLGVGVGDGERDAELLADKVVHLRVFPDEAGQMNRSVLEVGGGVLVVSQFTLYGDARRGRRPSYASAAPPAEAERLYEHFAARVSASGVAAGRGVFRAMMDVTLVNEGPVTLLLDSRRGF
jgi:D-tyrosyl-tRNA(Tyr) deacylase